MSAARVVGVARRAAPAAWALFIFVLCVNCGGASAPSPFSGSPVSGSPASDPHAAGNASGGSPGPREAPALREASFSRSDSESLVPIDADDGVWGAALAPVTLIEFADLQCPFCADAHLVVEELKRHYGSERLRVVFKHLPLDIHPGALPSALAAQSVRDLVGSAAFFSYLSRIFGNQHELSMEHLAEWAQPLGVPRDRLLARMNGSAAMASLRGDVALADRLNIRGTPAFRINGFELVGAQPVEQFEQRIDLELTQAAALVRRGIPPDQIYKERVRANILGAMPTL